MISYLQTLIDAGKCVLYQDYRSGSLYDWSGNGNNGSPTNGSLSRAGFDASNQNSRVTVPFAASLNLGNGAALTTITLLSENYAAKTNTFQRLYDQPDGIFAYFNAGGDTLTFQVGTNNANVSAFSAISLKTRCFGIDWTANGIPNLYANGVFYSAFSAAIAPNSTANILTLYNNSAGTRVLGQRSAATIMFNVALTGTEHALVFDELQRTPWPQAQYHRDRGRIQIPADKTGLVAAYNMRPVANQIMDESGHNNHGDIIGALYEAGPLGPSMRFDGIDDYVDCGAGFQTLTDLTVSFWMKPRTMITSEWIFNYYLNNLDAWGMRATIGAIEIYDDIDNAGAARYSTSVSTDNWIHVGAQLDNLENKLFIDGELVGSGSFALDSWASFAGNFYMGARTAGASETHCDLTAFRIRNYAMTPAEIADEYNAGARAVNFMGGWGAKETTAPVGAGGFLPGTPIEVISGTHDMITTDIDGTPTKAVICRTAGAVAFPASLFKVGVKGAARGSFRWWMLKALGGSTTKLAFVANQKSEIETAGFNGYDFRFAATERVQVQKITNGALATLITSATGFIDIGQFYECGVTLTNSAEITAYLSGILLDVTDGFGTTNPRTDATYTESSWVIWEPDAGDMFAWSDRRGEYSFRKLQGAPV